MSKVVSVLIILVLVAGVAYTAVATKVVVEAEKYTSIVPSMAKAGNTAASAGYCMQIPLRKPHGKVEGAPVDQGKAVYTVKIPQAGVYQFWGRCWWYDSCGNSFFLKIGSRPEVQLGQDGTYQTWHWVKGGPAVQLPAGNVTVVLRNREDGAKIDQFMLTRNLKYVPVRIEKK